MLICCTYFLHARMVKCQIHDENSNDLFIQIVLKQNIHTHIHRENVILCDFTNPPLTYEWLINLVRKTKILLTVVRFS